MSKIIGWKDINLSQEGLAKVQNLQPGQLMVVTVKHANSSMESQPKVQVELAEKVLLPGRAQSALAMLNTGDSRFSSGARRYWATANPADAKKYFGVELSPDESHKEICKLVNPLPNNTRFAIQLIEATEAQLPQNIREYKEYYEKRRGADGPQFVTAEGQPIYSYTNLVVVPVGENPQHVILEGQAVGDTVTLQNPAISSSMQEAMEN